MNTQEPNHGQGRRGLAGRVVDAVVGPIVAPLVDAVDVGGVVDRVDVDAVVDRIDVDGLIERIDVNGALERVDIDALIERIDVNRALDRLDLDRALERVDIDQLLERVDVNRVLERVDIDHLLERVDVNRVLDRIDADRLLDRVDADRVLDRVDVSRLIDRVDVDAVLARVDVNDLVRRTELGSVIARSTTGVFGELLDAARAVMVTVDLVVQGTVRRILRPGQEQRPGRPGALDDVVDARSMGMPERGVALQGHHAGSVSRFVAFLIDQFVLGVLFAAGQELFSRALEVIAGVTWELSDARWLAVGVYTVWAFLYFTVQLAITGRTIGMALLGLQVVRADGARLEARRAALRTLVFPLSFLLFGVGFLIGLVRRDRRELHDLIAGTAVVYAWDAELARLRARGATITP